MPIMPLTQLMSTATTLAGGRVDWSSSEVSLYVNAAAEFVGVVLKHSGQEALAYSSTTSGENRIAVPTDYDYGVGLSNLSVPATQRVRDLTKRDTNYVDSQGSTLGEPTYWVDYASWIELYPTPNSSYSLQLRYTTKTPTLVQPADTLPFRERFHMAVAYKASALLEASRNNLEGEAVAEQRFAGWMNNVPSDQALLQQRSKVGMGVRMLREG